jgi:hypothetical protein
LKRPPAERFVACDEERAMVLLAQRKKQPLPIDEAWRGGWFADKYCAHQIPVGAAAGCDLLIF